jgi:hypothetical protein
MIPCSGKQHHREGHFRRHEKPPASPLCGTTQRLLAATLEVRLQHAFSAARRLDQAKDERGQHGEADGERRDANVETERSSRRHDRHGSESDKRLCRPDGDEHSENRRAEREEEALGEHLLNEPRSTRAERSPQRHLTFTGGRARHEQSADIGAGNDQHEGNRAEHQPECRPHVADQLVRQRHDVHAEVGIRFGILALESRGDRAHLGPRCRHADTGLETRDRQQVMRAPHRHRRRRQDERRPQHGLARENLGRSGRRRSRGTGRRRA